MNGKSNNVTVEFNSYLIENGFTWQCEFAWLVTEKRALLPNSTFFQFNVFNLKNVHQFQSSWESSEDLTVAFKGMIELLTEKPSIL